MMNPIPVSELDWWQLSEPTAEELRLSGGLLVEDWPHARQVARLSAQLFVSTESLHHQDVDALRLLDRAALLHNTGMLIAARRHHKRIPEAGLQLRPGAGSDAADIGGDSARGLWL